jgi:quinol monooxygenase YgiN
MTMSTVTVLVEYRALPGQVERALAEIEGLVATVVETEPDCLGIRLLQDSADPERLLLVERWSSREAYLGPHRETPHLRAFIAGAAAFLAGPPDIRIWRELAERLPA